MYVSCFPQLIAGPIVRYQDIVEQVQGRRESLERFAGGARLFVVGLAKKVLLANIVALLAQRMLQQGGPAIGLVGAWSGLLAYTFQIYFDFSGYSDMAIGLGRMMGFSYLRNFNYPYISRSITEFWRRWHISLSSFFRDYVYIPLGGSRCSRGRWVVNLSAVWLLTGLWHGAAWNYILWGVYYGALASLPVVPYAKHRLVCWAEGTTVRDFAMHSVVNPRVVEGDELCTFAPSPTGPRERAWCAAAWWLANIALVALLAASLAQVVSGSFNPFIYFQF